MKILFLKVTVILIWGLLLLLVSACSSYEMVKISSRSIELKAPEKNWKIWINNLPEYDIEKYSSVNELPYKNIEVLSQSNIFINKNCQIEILFWKDPRARKFDLAFLRITSGISVEERSEFKDDKDNLIPGFPEKVLNWDRINEKWLNYGISLRQLTIFSYYDGVSFRITYSKMFYTDSDEHLFDDFIKNLKFVKLKN